MWQHYSKQKLHNYQSQFDGILVQAFFFTKYSPKKIYIIWAVNAKKWFKLPRLSSPKLATKIRNEKMYFLLLLQAKYSLLYNYARMQTKKKNVRQPTIIYIRVLVISCFRKTYRLSEKLTPFNYACLNLLVGVRDIFGLLPVVRIIITNLLLFKVMFPHNTYIAEKNLQLTSCSTISNGSIAW